MTRGRADTRPTDDSDAGQMMRPDQRRGEVILGNFPIGWGYAYRPQHPKRPRRRPRFKQLRFDFTEEKQ